MTLWHASTELQMTATAVVAKTAYLATRYTGRLEKGLGLAQGLYRSADLGAELTTKLSAELDTSG